MLLQAVPEAIANVIEMATGEKGRASDQLAAACKVIEWARVVGPNGAAGALASANLAELPLDQLESVLAGTLEHVRSLRSIEGQSQHVEEPTLSVPDVGTEAPGKGPAPGPQASLL